VLYGIVAVTAYEILHDPSRDNIDGLAALLLAASTIFTGM